MAKANSGISMSQHIRDVLSENPNLSGKEIVSALAAKGLKAKPALVYYVKARFKAKTRRGRQRKAVANVMSGSNGAMDPVALISKTKALAAEVGGMPKLKELVEALS
jgi:hypothetical protein